MSPRVAGGIVLVALLALPAAAYEYCGGWGGSNVVINLYPKPLDVFSDPAEYQLAEWNLVQGDTSRPFRLLDPPIDTIAQDDGRNSAAFLDEATLQARYGLSFGGGVLAWTSSLSYGGCTLFVESDVIFRAELSWYLSPGSPWFQAVALHEFGHVLGFEHYDDSLSIMNTYAWGEIGGETLFMDDREGFRRYYEEYFAIPSETDVALYAKYHDGFQPQWASFPGPVVQAGDALPLDGFTVENLGTEPLSPVTVGFYLSTNSIISPSDVFLGGVFWSTLDRFYYGIASTTVTIPGSTREGYYYLGAIADHGSQLSESNEGNNTVVLGDGSGTPAAIYVQGTTTSTTTSTITTTSTSSTTTTRPLPLPIPRKQCARLCRPAVKACKASCDDKACRRRCKPRIVRGCKTSGVCEALAVTGGSRDS